MKWRRMHEADIPHVKKLADAVHKNYPEDEAIFAEKFKLYPEGCFSLIQDNALAGYIVSHPWRRGETPEINKLLGVLPQNPDTLYWHDIVIAPAFRGKGAVGKGIALVLAKAKADGFESVSGTAVSGTAKFWQRKGFKILPPKASGLSTYGDEARSMVYFFA